MLAVIKALLRDCPTALLFGCANCQPLQSGLSDTITGSACEQFFGVLDAAFSGPHHDAATAAAVLRRPEQRLDIAAARTDIIKRGKVALSTHHNAIV